MGAVVRILAPLTRDLHAQTKARNATADPKDIDLFEAVRIGDVAAIQREGVDVINARNGEQETLIHKACLFDHLANQAKVVKRSWRRASTRTRRATAAGPRCIFARSTTSGR